MNEIIQYILLSLASFVQHSIFELHHALSCDSSSCIPTIYHNIFIYWPWWIFGLFLAWMIMISANMNTFYQVFFFLFSCTFIHISFVYVNRHRIVGSHDMYVLPFRRYCQLVFQRVYAPNSRVRRVTVVACSCQPLIFSVFFIEAILVDI